MFRWLQFWRKGPSRPTAESESLAFTPDQIDLPTPEQRRIMANYVNSGNAVFGVDPGGTGEISVLGTGEYLADPGPDPKPPGTPS